MNTKTVTEKTERKKLKRTARKKAAPKAKRASGVARGSVKKKVKSSTRVDSDDDDDGLDSNGKSGTMAGSDGNKDKIKSEVVRTTGFHKPMLLSPSLSSVVGETTLSRPQTVKRIWEYIRTHGLQDEKDKRQICCDDALRAVFKQDRVHMFTMNKLLGQNMYSPDE